MIAVGKPKSDMPEPPRSLDEPESPEEDAQESPDDEAQESEHSSVEDRLATIEATLAEIADWCRSQQHGHSASEQPEDQEQYQ